MLILLWGFHLSDLQKRKMDLEGAGRLDFENCPSSQAVIGGESLCSSLAMEGFSSYILLPLQSSSKMLWLSQETETAETWVWHETHKHLSQ